MDITRRELLRASAGAGAVAAAVVAVPGVSVRRLTGDASAPPAAQWAATSGGGLPPPPFLLGVASGDPLPTSVVLWTRLVRDPFVAASMGALPVSVDWQVAEDPAFRSVVRSGTVRAEPAWAHSVHVDPGGLRPGRPYWYRFRALGQISPVGRTRTAAAPRTRTTLTRLAVASCQNWQDGHYAAHAAIAEEDLDAVVFLGDYVYETGPREPATDAVRLHDAIGSGSEVLTTLDDYRNRYALYKSDLALQAAHHAHPWIVLWDDHEVRNNYSGGVAAPRTVGRGPSPRAFGWRREAAYQAYYEHLPLRPAPARLLGAYAIHRRFRFGRLLELSVLDVRAHRRHPPAALADGPPVLGRNPEGSITGAAQERWLLSGLGRSGARWNVVAQQVLMARAELDGSVELDAWDGYATQRSRILTALRDADVRNPVVLSGDRHQTWVNDLVADFDLPGSPVVASEFVCPSVSSLYGRGEWTRADRDYPAQNPHVRLVDSTHHGYLRCVATRDAFTVTPTYVTDLTRPDAGAFPAASWVVADGLRGVQRA